MKRPNILHETLLTSTQIYQGKVITVCQDTVELANGKTATREIVKHPGAVAIVPITDNDEIILVRQFRHAVANSLLEIPAGKLDPNETPALCAKRELIEETGFAAGQIQLLTTIFTTPGFSNEVLTIYLAEQLHYVGSCPDEDEFLELEYYPLAQIDELIASGQIQDAKTIIGLLLAQTSLNRVSI